MKHLRTIFAVILLSVGTMLTMEIIHQSNIRHEMVLDNSELNNVKYGLMSVHSWKEKVSEILSKKIEEFDITTENRQEIGQRIESILNQLLDEVELIMARKKSQGGLFRRAATSMFQTLVFDTSDLRRKIPEFREIILDELDNPQTREKLKEYLLKQINQLLHKTVGKEDLSALNQIMNKYDIQHYNDRLVLQEKVRNADQELKSISYKLLTLIFILFIIIIVYNKKLTAIHHYLLIGGCLLLLYGGICTPMLEIDARISDFSFLLMGEPLEFTNQILFNQSKSILEVVQILTATGEHQAILVGILILVFSIAFPLLKMLSTIAVMNNNKLANNQIVNFLAFKSGKWSMVDVLVVAIFIAYIGFQGVIENQLKQLENMGSNIEILTTDNSSFGIGFALFFGFCIASMVLSTVLERRLKNS